MEIKDIVEREKHKRTLAKIKKREDTIARKQFLKDCYKCWKEYKKVESPYFWWLGWFRVEYVFFGYWENSRKVMFELTKDYVDSSWFSKKWETKWIIGVGYRFRRKTDPNNTFIGIIDTGD